MLNKIYSCEICGAESNQLQRWVVIHCDKEQLTVHKWSTEVADQPEARHYCGEGHAQVYISRWFQNYCS